MIVASAQTNPHQKSIEENFADHYQMINQASEHGAQLIVFPEMSLTGYVRERAQELSFSENDSRLKQLQQLSADKNIIIIAGAPITMEDSLYIGAFIIKPDHTTSVYTKQFLHTGEEVYFNASFNYNPTFNIGDETISIAICADINNPLHPENASNASTTFYVASIFYTPSGISEAYNDLSAYAKKYHMNILMSNYCGNSYDYEAAGQSVFFDKNGKMIAQLNGRDTGLLLLENTNGFWAEKAIIK